MAEEGSTSAGVQIDVDSIATFNDIPLNHFGIVTTKVATGKRVTVFMSRNRTAAYLLVEPVDSKFTVTTDEVLTIINKTGTFVPEWGKERVDHVVANLNGTGGEDGRRPVLFSEGVAKEDGHDSKVTWHVDISTAGDIDMKPVNTKGSKAREIRVQVNSREARMASGGKLKARVPIEDDAQVDYRAAKDLPQVSKGQLICTVSAPTEGKDGKDVTGKPLKARDGEWIHFECGDGVETNPERTEYRADESGFLFLSGKSINIRMMLTVPKVDFNSGNIDYRGRVEVVGDVGEGFSVKAGQDLMVGGTGKDVQLQSGRRISIEALLGEKSFARCGGDFHASRVVNATVLAEGAASITQELVNATLHAAGSVNATEANMVGGMIVSAGPIYLRGAGSPSEGGTQAIVIDPNLLKVGPVATTIAELKEGKATIEKIRTALGPLAENPSLVVKLPEDRRAAILQLLERLSTLTREQVGLRDQYAKAVDQLNKRIKPEVYIKRIFPGTTVKLLEAEKTFTEMSSQPLKLYLDRGGKEIIAEPWLAREEVDLG